MTHTLAPRYEAKGAARQQLSMLALRVSCACCLLAGCSALFVNAPPDNVSGDVEPTCTTSAAAPVVDAVVASLQAIRIGFAALADDSVYRDFPISRGADIAIGAALTVAFAASAGHGFSATAECSELKARARRHRAPPREPPMPPVHAAPPAPAAIGTPPPPAADCTHDAQCEGSRICEQGSCADYSPMP